MDSGAGQPGEERLDFQRAANAYLLWPLAAAAVMREPPGESYWVRLHSRQALVFGVCAALCYAVLLAVPLLIVIADPAISTGTTVLVYGIGLSADVAGFVLWVFLTVRYASRAGRGELFSIPFVSGLADRLFPVRR